MQVKEYMQYRRLPKSLRLRIHDYYENRYQAGVGEFDSVRTHQTLRLWNFSQLSIENFNFHIQS